MQKVIRAMMPQISEPIASPLPGEPPAGAGVAAAGAGPAAAGGV